MLLAKAYKGKGDNNKAKEAVQKALDIGKSADDTFISSTTTSINVE